jgi:hypothetical protein
MALFDKKSEIPRSQFKNILGKSDVKAGAGKQLSAKQKILMEKRDFPRKFGESISKAEYKMTVNKLKSERRGQEDFSQKLKLGKKIKFLEELEKKGDSLK